MDTEACNTKLQDLNEECLRHIFQYLSSFEDKWHFYTACSKWIQVGPGFWKIAQFSVLELYDENENKRWDFMPNRKLTFMQFQEVITHCASTFQKLTIVLDDDSDLSMQLAYSFDNTVYRIDGEFNYESTLDILIESCHNLKKLEIDAYAGHPRLAEKFHALIRANKKLAEVHLTCGNKADLYNIVRLKDVPGPAKILHLNISIPRYPVHNNVDIICDLLKSGKVNLKSLSVVFENTEVASRLIQAVANYAKELLVFTIKSWNDTEWCGSEPYLGLEKVAALEDLQELSIFILNMNVTDQVISKIADGCRKLKTIELNRCNSITNEGINTLMTSLPTLVSVSLSSLQISSILQSSAQWTIHSLEVHDCDDVPEDELKKISVFFNLEELSISLSDYKYDGYRRMTDGVISAISIGCKKLKKVEFFVCGNITNEGLNTLMTSLPMLESVELNQMSVDSIIHNDAQTSVRSLRIFDCNNLSEDELKKISRFKNLEELHMDDLHNATDEVFSTISNSCKKLKAVHLAGPSVNTSKGIYSLVTALPNLETLELTCACLPSTFVSDLPESNLQRLTIIACGDFPEVELETFLLKMPKLKHFDVAEE